MSQENVELVRSAFAAGNRGDLEPGSTTGTSRPDSLRAQLEGRAYHGHKGLRRFLADIAEGWEGLRFEMDEIQEADQQIVGSGRFQAAGQAADLAIADVGTPRFPRPAG
jgi:hypothetical protein